ncbi:MAG: sulfite exporter TauE/SafE family protein [Pirellulaceae bacterium]
MWSHQAELLGLLGGLGILAGFLAGLVGLGGGIILAPLLLYVPSALGMEPLNMKVVARLTIIQSLCSTAAAGFAHRRARHVHTKLVLWMGPTIFTASLAGAFASEAPGVSSEMLVGLFAGLALLAAVLMFGCPENGFGDKIAPPHQPFSRPRAVIVALGVGFLGGMVGQSGAFLTIPLLVKVLGFPVRLAIGSSLLITFCAALAGSVGKLAGGGSVVWSQVGALVAGSLLGSQLGAGLSHRTPTVYLRYGLALLIAVAAARMWYQVLT